MTREKFTGVTANDLGPTQNPYLKVIGVFRRQWHRNRAKYTTQSAYFMSGETTDKMIVYARNTEMDIPRYARRIS